MVPDPQWESATVGLGPEWSLLLYTDGIIEGRIGPTTCARLGVDGLTSMVAASHKSGADPVAFADSLIAEAERRHGGPLSDDIALFLLTYSPSGSRERR